MTEILLPKKNNLSSAYQAEIIRKLNETKQYTLMATALLERVLTDSKLTPCAAKLWEYLYTKAIMNPTLSVTIKYKDLGKKFNRSERSMKRYVDNLKKNGYLHIESNFHYHGQRANTFYLRVPENTIKLLEQTKDRYKRGNEDFGRQDEIRAINDGNENPQQLIYDCSVTNNSVVDKIVTPDHDTNVTPNNNIKKDILINNNNVVVDDYLNQTEINKTKKSCSQVLRETNRCKKNNPSEDDEIKIRETEKKINELFIKMGQATGEERVPIFDEIRKLQANISTIEIMMGQKKQSALLPINTLATISPELYSSIDFSQVTGERKLSEHDVIRIKKSLRKLVVQHDQGKICNEIVYAVRFGALKVAQNGEVLSISHAISIALKLVREKRWETPTQIQTKKNYFSPTKFASLGKRIFHGQQPVSHLLKQLNS